MSEAVILEDLEGRRLEQIIIPRCIPEIVVPHFVRQKINWIRDDDLSLCAPVPFKKIRYRRTDECTIDPGGVLPLTIYRQVGLPEDGA